MFVRNLGGRCSHPLHRRGVIGLRVLCFQRVPFVEHLRNKAVPLVFKHPGGPFPLTILTSVMFLFRIYLLSISTFRWTSASLRISLYDSFTYTFPIALNQYHE